MQKTQMMLLHRCAPVVIVGTSYKDSRCGDTLLNRPGWTVELAPGLAESMQARALPFTVRAGQHLSPHLQSFHFITREQR